VTARAGQIGQLVRTLGGQLREVLTSALGINAIVSDPIFSARDIVVAKVSRNAVAELVNQARTHPQRGDLASANPAYVALAELAEITGLPGLALGLKSETGEISFLDLNLDLDLAAQTGGAYVERPANKNMWRQLKQLVARHVDSTMLGPSRPIRSPEEFDDFPDEVG
jgi:hypothetical protein